MTKELPVGISESKFGYRLHRTVKGKEYNFGSFQNINHALRTNEYIDIIIKDLRDAQSKEGLVSIDQVQKILAENSLSDMEEITRLINDSNRHMNQKVLHLVEQNGLLMEANKRLETKFESIVTVMQLESQKTLWQKIKGK